MDLALDGDRPCWGESGLPLLPTEWRPWLPDHRIDTREPGQKRGAIIELSFLCSAVDWSRYFHRRLGLDVAVEAFVNVLVEDPEPSFIDTPIVPGRYQDTEAIGNLPFLLETWSILESTFGNLESIAEALACCTALEILQFTECPTTVLDVAITAPSWTDDSEGGFLAVVSPAVPTDITEAFELAGLRHLKTACVKDKYLDPGSPWFAALCGRAGFSIDGQLTLDEAGQLVGVVRERVRQVVAGFPLGHSKQRRWPLSDELRIVKGVLDNAIARGCSDVEKELNQGGGGPCHLSVEQADRLLGWYGWPTGLAVDATGLIRPDDASLGLPEDLTLHDVRRMVWELSEGTGFLREPDLANELMRRHPDLDREHTNGILDAAVGHLRLPLDYLFFTTHKAPVVIGVFERMLAWVNPLPLVDLHEGLVRKFRFRQFPVPPPLDVIRALVERLDDLDIENDIVSTRSRRDRDSETILGWINMQLQEVEGGVLHRSTILEACRRARLNTTSVGIYLQFGETIRPVGRGCFALVGTTPTEESITTARASALRAQVQNRVTATYPAGGMRLAITIGNALRDSGVVSVSVRVKRLVADRLLVVKSRLGTHGNLAMSHSLLYGFSTVLNALEAMPGDDLVVDIDLRENTAFVHLPDESDD